MKMTIWMPVRHLSAPNNTGIFVIGTFASSTTGIWVSSLFRLFYFHCCSLILGSYLLNIANRTFLSNDILTTLHILDIFCLFSFHSKYMEFILWYHTTAKWAECFCWVTGRTEWCCYCLTNSFFSFSIYNSYHSIIPLVIAASFTELLDVSLHWLHTLLTIIFFHDPLSTTNQLAFLATNAGRNLTVWTPLGF